MDAIKVYKSNGLIGTYSGCVAVGPQVTRVDLTLGIKHIAEEYNGTHINRLAGLDGRLYTEMLIFFTTYLQTASKEPASVR